MSNNILVKDGAGVDTSMKTTEVAGVHTPHHNIDSFPDFGTTADEAATTDTGAFSLIALFKRLLTSLTGGIFIYGQTEPVTYTLTRPADTNAYLAKDVIANATSGAIMIPFANIARMNGGSGYITKIRLIVVGGTAIRMRLHLYKTNGYAQQDNATFTRNYVNAASFTDKVASIDMPTLTTYAGSDIAYSEYLDLRVAFKCASGARDLYCVLETLDAFNPTSSQKFFIEVTADNN